MSKILRIARYLISCCKGALLVRRLTRKNTATYIMNNQHIGDVCYALSMIEAYKKHYALQDVRVIWSGKFRHVYDAYEGFSLCRLDFDKQMDILAYFMKSPHGRKMIENRRFVITNTSFYMNFREQERLGLSVVELLREYAFRLPMHVRPVAPNTKNPVLDEMLVKKIRRGKTVLINPTAQSMHIPVDFFDRIARELISRGYYVLTNLSAKDGTPLPGTHGVFLPLDDTCRLLEYCGHSIGVRSGFYDYAIFSNCRFFVLYDASYPMRRCYRLDAWQSCSPLYEYTVDKENEDEIFDRILAAFPKVSLSTEG